MNMQQFMFLTFTALASFNLHPMESKKQLSQGILIAIEGIDGAGKSTLANAVYSRLKRNGFDVILTREPGDTGLGKEIRTIVQTQKKPVCAKAQYLLFAADRAQRF